ncbi:hydrolase [Streptomyces sp. Ru71]|uniref:RICIN domain-containing protein n=1 Tax=Streptomyces sp. Ru71 TaxID=2080746 RepID=UPI000CDDE71B|nr:RICIN domain-containing protein [Streptomyces sp. Ru71]POX54440.1 hydrolase [Streptomyces sp. Ru71]
MPTPHPPRPHRPPSGGSLEESDEALAVRARGGPDDDVAQATALLMARHWQPVHDYAVICLASSAQVAAMVTAAAFHQVLDRLTLGEPAAALRPRLLLAVRGTVRQWAAAERIAGVLPQLRKPAGGRGMRVAKDMTPENRRLTELSFHALPAPAQCLLWHIDVEAEPITVPAGLLGMTEEAATAAYQEARDKLREGCVRAHRELAPSPECRHHNRLLDIPLRRGSGLLPEVRRHLAQCRHCRAAAEQLRRFESALGPLLAEAVLGWGARRYLDSRPGRRGRAGGHGRGAARHRGGRPGRRLLPFGPRSPRAVLTGAGLASAGVLTLLLASGGWSDDGPGPGQAASATTVGGAPAATAPLPPAASTAPPGTAQLPTKPRRTRLRNVAADLCLDIRGRATAGAQLQLAVCSSASTQQWSYEDDGLLRSVAAPQLCLDSHADAGVVILGPCAPRGDRRADDVRYDLTVRGELLPRWDETLALAATSQDMDGYIVVEVRDGSAARRWHTDSPPPGSAPNAAPATHPARPVDLTNRA